MATMFAPLSRIPSVHNQFANFIIRDPNADDSLISNRIIFQQRSQMFGEALRASSRFYLPLLDRSQAGCLAVCCSFPANQLGTSSKIRSSDWYLCALVDQALRGRSKLWSQERLLHTTRGRNKTWMVRCIGNSATAAAAGGVALKPWLDEVLLLGTLFGVYIAGVASLPRLPQLFPDRESSSARQDSATSKKSANINPTRKPKPKRQSPESSGGDGWSLLQSKLYQAVSIEITEVEEQVVKNPMLGLQAIARVPRLHLLLTTLQHIRKEAG